MLHSYQEAGHRRQIDSMLHSYQEAGHRRQIESMLHSYQEGLAIYVAFQIESMLHSYGHRPQISLCCILIEALAANLNQFYIVLSKLAATKSILYCISYQEAVTAAPSILCCTFLSRSCARRQIDSMLHSYQEAGHKQIDSMFAFLSKRPMTYRFYVAFLSRSWLQT
ncbi:unnamed protein product [Acanthosepion pharaonis]|uniref:Uncharacterized protein n=1 Tax=Acanthosepion pharaonis TaxID=158019 RepID=A0A812CJ79_ACAPH|nr:unnamed protein product [Sepia pharaonis]